MDGTGLVVMGRSAGAFGLKGEMKISSFAEDDGVFERAGGFFIGPSEDQAVWMNLENLRFHGGRMLIRTREVQTREDAAATGGRWIYLRREQLGPLEDGEYYWVDLQGAEVRTKDGRMLGRVHTVMSAGAGDIIVVRADGKKDLLIPVNDENVLGMDFKAGEVLVDPQEGLLEAQGWDE